MKNSHNLVLILCSIICLATFFTVHSQSRKVSRTRSSATNVEQQTGFTLTDIDAKEVEPKGCGPFRHWNLANRNRIPEGKITYYISSKGGKDLSLPDIRKAAEESFRAWSEIPGVALDFKFAGFLEPYASGTFTGKQYKEDEPDGKNVIFFDETGKFFPKDQASAYGRTIPRQSNRETGEIYEVDIVLNGTYVPRKFRASCAQIADARIEWSLTEQRCVGLSSGNIRPVYRLHLQSTLTHEIGHFIGFGHSLSIGATMSTGEISDFAQNTNQASLEDDDRDAARFLYSRVSNKGANLPCGLVSRTIEIPAKIMWVDTGIDVTGKRFSVKYESGKWSNGGTHPIFSSATGSGRWPGLIVPNAPFRGLVGKTDSGPFYVGRYREMSNQSGRLYLSMNDTTDFADNIGSLHVLVSLYP